jgi:hypothetical protein
VFSTPVLKRAHHPSFLTKRPSAPLLKGAAPLKTKKRKRFSAHEKNGEHCLVALALHKSSSKYPSCTLMKVTWFQTLMQWDWEGGGREIWVRADTNQGPKP